MALKLISKDYYDDISFAMLEDGKSIENPEEVSRMLSAYFLAQEKRTLLRVGDSFCQVDLHIDEDEAYPTSVYVDANNGLLTTYEFNNKLILRSLFYNFCFEYECVINDMENDEDSSMLSFELSLPTRISVVKQRRTVRSRIEQEEDVLQIKAEGFESAATILNISSDCIHLKIDQTSPSEGLRNVIIKNDLIEVLSFEVFNKSDSIIILRPICNSIEEYILYFRFYLDSAHKNVNFNTDIDLENLKELYQASRSGAGLDAGDKMLKKTEQCLRTKSRITKEQHPVNIELAIKSKDSNSYDASCSATHTFKIENKDVFSWHSFFCRRGLQHLNSSLLAYQLRIEFFQNINREFKVFCWYDSSGKWVDKIWGRFYYHNREDVLFKDVNFFDPKTEPDNLYSIEQRQFISDKPDLFGAVGPKYITSTNALDCMVLGLNDPTVDPSVLSDFSGFKFQVISPLQELGNNFTKRESRYDKCLLFDKEKLLELLSCIEHARDIYAQKLNKYKYE